VPDDPLAPGRGAEPSKRAQTAQTVRTVVVTVLVIALVLIAAANTDETEVDLLVEDFTFPLVGLIAGVGAIGFAAGFLVSRRRSNRD
jgi:uncharacterized integral membrane protein